MSPKSIIKKREKLISWISLVSAVILFSGCVNIGTNKSSKKEPKPVFTQTTIKKLKAYYVDAPIVNIDYKCGKSEGKTDSTGAFLFEQGSGCNFWLGSMKLMEVASSVLRENLVIIESDLDIATLLQSLDRDGMRDGKINIDDDVVGAIKKSNFKTPPKSDEERAKLIKNINNILKPSQPFTPKTKKEALEHLQKSIKMHIVDDTVLTAKIDFDNTPKKPETKKPNRDEVGSNDANVKSGKESTNSSKPKGNLNKTPKLPKNDTNKPTSNQKPPKSDAENKTSDDKPKDETKPDTNKPQITLKGGKSISLERGTKYQELGFQAIDSVDGDITGKVKVTGSVNSNKEGKYTLTYRIADSSGNEATATRTITIKKITPLATTKDVIFCKSEGRNLLTNGSFELGLGAEPFYIGWSPKDARKDLTPPPLPTIDDSTSAYGDKSLKFTIPNREKFFTIDFKPPYIADSGRYDIYIGVSAKTNCPNKVRLDLYTKGSQAIQSRDWKRYTFHTETDKPVYPIYKIRLLNETSDNRSCDVWLDGFTWTLKEKDKDNFVRSDIVEAVFTPTPNLISMHFRKNDVTLKANIDSNQSRKVVAELHIRDLTRDGADKVYQKREISLDANKVLPYEINLGKLKHGAYMAHLVFIDKKSKKILGEAREKFTVMSDLTKIAPPVDFIVGMHGGLSGFTDERRFDYRGYWSIDEYYQEAYQIGIRAQRMIVGAGIIPKEDGKIDFSLEAPAINAASRNGCTTLLAINPFKDVPKGYQPSGKAGDWIIKDENRLTDGVNDFRELYRLPEDKLIKLYEYVASEFGDKLLGVENENELNMFYTADGMKYAVRDLFKPIYKPFKAIAPNVPIFVDITMDFYGLDFTKNFFKNEGAKYSDGVTYHPYLRESIYQESKNGKHFYGINYIKRDENYINADYGQSKKLIMGMSEIHEVGILNTIGWDAMQRILLDWSGGAKFSAGILSEGLYFLEARDKSEWHEKSPHATGVGAVAINGMYSVLGGYKLLERIDLQDKNNKILIVAFKNDKTNSYAIAIAQGDLKNQRALVNVALPSDTEFYDQWGEKIKKSESSLNLSNEILYITSKNPELVQNFRDLNENSITWLDEPNGYDYEPKLTDFKARPDGAWFQELLQTEIHPRKRIE